MTETPEFVLCLYRATAHFRAMATFLEAVGLHRTVRRDAEGSAIFWGRRGMIALYAAQYADGPVTPGETQLSFETPDLDAAADALQSAGTRVKIWADQGQERTAGLTDNRGEGIFLRESMRDPDDAGEYEPHRVDVVALRPTTTMHADTEFFAGFGFLPLEGASEGWTALQGAGDAGVIGLHAPWTDGPKATTEPSPIGAPALAILGFQTNGPLDTIAARLTAAGFTPRPVGEGIDGIAVVDPDGVEIQIRHV